MHQARHGILLDEPSLGQDGEHKQILANLLKTLAESGYLVIFSTHDLELAAQSDRMVLLNSGWYRDHRYYKGSSCGRICLEGNWTGQTGLDEVFMFRLSQSGTGTYGIG